ncbi:MAG: hybrid sensor histidine kinase/response regulator [Proteobacteria bacterium]|nr:hybrid sensor histidine kinase/response regulator [Pseudomonadota bacterium]
MNSKHRILAVDDNEIGIRTITRIFSSKYSLEAAMSGEEALKLIPNFRPDLILLDIMMPGMDGYEICRRIRTNERFNFIKIVLVSGKGELEERLKGYEAGADDYVTKPFDNEELLAKVRVFLRLKRAEEVDQIKSDLITLFSHETKTPLSGVIGIADVLREDDTLSDEARKGAEIIYKSGHQLLEFVRKTSLFCELKSGTKLNISRGSPVQHLKNTLIAMGKNSVKKDITIRLQIKKDTLLNADWILINTVFRYILDNAVKYSPNGSKVLVQTEMENGSYHIHITNKGDGIDPEWIDSIFDEFAIRNVMNHHKGQGLSLAISKHVLDLHGGALGVESTPGNGATFTVSLPIQESPTA